MRSTADRLARRGAELAGIDPLTLAVAEASDVHRALLGVLTDLMELARRYTPGAAIPAPLKVMFTMLDKGQPLLLEQLAGVPDEAIQDFVAELIDKLTPIVKARGDGSAGAASSA